MVDPVNLNARELECILDAMFIAENEGAMWEKALWAKLKQAYRNLTRREWSYNRSE